MDLVDIPSISSGTQSSAASAESPASSAADQSGAISNGAGTLASSKFVVGAAVILATFALL